MMVNPYPAGVALAPGNNKQFLDAGQPLEGPELIEEKEDPPLKIVGKGEERYLKHLLLRFARIPGY